MTQKPLTDFISASRFAYRFGMITKLRFLAIASMCIMTSCATIFTGTKDAIRFESTPQGARVYIDGLEICKTPCTIRVQRSLSDKIAEIKLDGYETNVILLEKEFNTVSILNFANLFGWAIDVATGAVTKYDKKGYDIEFEKNGMTSLLENPSKIEIDTDNKVVSVYIVH